MQNLITLTTQEVQDARKAGFKRKRPKKPAASAKMATLERFAERYNAWAKEMKAKASEGKKLREAREKVRKV